VMDMLVIQIARAKEAGQVEGVIPRLIKMGCLSYSMRMTL